MSSVPEGSLTGENKTLSTSFREYLNGLETNQTTETPVDYTDQFDNRLAQFQALKSKFDSLAVNRFFDSGAVSGQAVSVLHNLGTKNIIYTISKTSDFRLVSVEIVSKNAVTVTGSQSLTYSNIRIRALE